jgi:hypothetical protein
MEGRGGGEAQGVADKKIHKNIGVFYGDNDTPARNRIRIRHCRRPCSSRGCTSSSLPRNFSGRTAFLSDLDRTLEHVV